MREKADLQKQFGIKSGKVKADRVAAITAHAVATYGAAKAAEPQPEPEKVPGAGEAGEPAAAPPIGRPGTPAGRAVTPPDWRDAYPHLTDAQIGEGIDKLGDTGKIKLARYDSENRSRNKADTDWDHLTGPGGYKIGGSVVARTRRSRPPTWPRRSGTPPRPRLQRTAAPRRPRRRP